MRHLPSLPLVYYIFVPNLLKFAKGKFGANPFFRPVWPMGRVVEVLTGEDRGVRSARVKTARGVFHRPVTKICLLEEVSGDQ